MDHQLDIYSNVDGPSHDHRKWTRETESSEHIYANLDEIHTLEPISTGPALSDAETVKKSSCRAAAVCLGLLCLLLLTGLITLVYLYTKGKTEMILLHNSYNNMTEERDQLQTGYNNVAKQRDQLQTGYNNVAKQRDQLQTGYNNVAKQRDQLQTGYNSIEKQRDQLRKTVEDITEERNELQRRIQVMTVVVRNRLWMENGNLSSKRDKLGLGETAYCPDYWITFGKSCYFKSTSKKNWTDSKKFCEDQGTHLVIISNEKEQKFISSFNLEVWIGLTDEETEGVWKWVDGTEVTETYWGNNQPDNYPPAENCVVIITHSSDSENWNDLSCSESSHFICEINL